MQGKIYSQRLGVISDEQFQAALDRFNLGRFLRAEAIPFGMWGQNVFVSSTEGEYVLRGQSHFDWQFPTEQFYTRLLHERTAVPVPWPYLLDATTDIFGQVLRTVSPSICCLTALSSGNSSNGTICVGGTKNGHFGTGPVNTCRWISFSESFLFACFLSILLQRGNTSSIDQEIARKGPTMELPTNYRTLSSTSPRGLQHNLPPMRLWQKAKRLGIWNPMDIDLMQDKVDWQGLKEVEKDYILGLCSKFLAGEESVTLDLLPLIKVVAKEGRIEEEMYLTSFLWEEAKHVEGFRRFFDEVAQDHGDLTRFYDAAYARIFYDELPTVMNRLETDSSVEAQVRASTTYNMIIEGVMAETGYYAFYLVLTRNNLMPGMQQFIANLKRDESRHIAFAVYFLSRLVAEHGDVAWNALEGRMYELMPIVRESSASGYTRFNEGIPFNINPKEMAEYSTTQFNKRLERIRKARTQTLDEINNVANSLDEVLA